LKSQLGFSSKLFDVCDKLLCGMLSKANWEMEVNNYMFKYQVFGRNVLDNIEVRDDLELTKTQTETCDDSGFIINGKNSTDTIRNLTSLTGLPIEELERKMLPDERTFSELKAREYHGSNDSFGGFIKPGESLIEIMASDNDYVLGRGYTHQDVAKPMFRILNALTLTKKHRLKLLRFKFDDETYIVDRAGFPMFQDSPFNDGISTPGSNVHLTKESTGDKFSFAALCPFLIHRYGFYEGNVPYRVDPQKAIDFFK
jgi:hypothetical protein